jgi:hypothetical protein
LYRPHLHSLRHFTGLKDWLKGDGLYSNEKGLDSSPSWIFPDIHANLGLALWLREEEDAQERAMLEDAVGGCESRWSLHSWDYLYIQGSLGEFSCVKPSCVRFGTWISDRTLLPSSGKPL